ncbi:MAG: hypothetical protein WC705_03155 [Candidatus Paceibacterota bacterium]|jgi:sulfite exporter TauE/SafE
MEIIGGIGVLIIALAIWIKKEGVQDILFIIGGAFLLAYSVYLNNIIFIVLQCIFIISSFLEIVSKKK